MAYIPGLFIHHVLHKLLVLINVDIVSSDDVISETSVQFSSVRAPGQSGGSIGISLWLSGFFLLGSFDNQLGNWVIRFVAQVEDVNTVFTSSSDPLLKWVEGNLGNWGTSVEGSVFFSQVREVPNLEDVFLTSGSDVSSQWGNGEGVNVFLVCLPGVLDQEVGLPNFNSTVPTSSGEVWVLGNWGVSDAGNPIGVVVGFVGVFAVSEGVPKLEGLVGTSRDDLSVIKGEADGVDFLTVASEDSGGLSGS